LDQIRNAKRRIPNEFEWQKSTEEGRKGGRKEGKTEDAAACFRGEHLLAEHDCGFVGSGDFSLGLLSFEFV
jgi:hypothetical protein